MSTTCAVSPLDAGRPTHHIASQVPLDTKSTIEVLRARCPLPVLLKALGLAKHAKRSCCSPLRRESSPSWGIYQRDGRWFWKDLGTDEGGDEIDFLAAYKDLELPKDFNKVLTLWESVAAKCAEGTEPEALPVEEPRTKPSLAGFGLGTWEQLDRLSRLRGIAREGLELALERRLLGFGLFMGHEAYGITDSSGRVLELRRLDGQPFPAYGALAERKSHAAKGSQKSWPVGIQEAADKPMILLTEGLPDFLAAFEVITKEGARERVAPVTVLAASARIAPEALPLFTGKHVRIVPHCDEPGRNAASAWKRQLVQAGASKVDFVDLNNGDQASPIKDLNDYLPVYRNDLAAGGVEGRLL